MGQQRSGDTVATHNSIVNESDFTTLKNLFCTSSWLGDLNNDRVTSGADFTLLKNNFETAGPPLACPRQTSGVYRQRLQYTPLAVRHLPGCRYHGAGHLSAWRNVRHSSGVQVRVSRDLASATRSSTLNV